MISVQKYNINDIVRIKGVDDVYYMITHIVDLNGKGIKELSYRLVKIYPVSNVMESVIVNQRDTVIVAKSGKHEHGIVIACLNEEYRNIGYKDLTHFIMRAITLPPSDKRNNVKKKAIATKRKNKTKTKNNHLSIEKQMQDAIFYHEIDNIDECLDAMNDLKALYKNFGDEAYLQLYDLVRNRLKQLVNKK